MSRSETISMSDRFSTQDSHSVKLACKFNTLTPSEARKLTRGFGGRVPVRTASVLHKPRAPSTLIVTSLDDFSQTNSKITASLGNNACNNNQKSRFSNHLSNLKRIFRYVPIGRSFMSNDIETKSEQTTPTKNVRQMSRTSLDDSQSPTVFPPPPNELKTMSYLLNAARYSNYDEFTSTRNKISDAMMNNSLPGRRRDGPNGSAPLREDHLSSARSRENLPHQSHNRPRITPRIPLHDTMKGSCESWQLTSLPTDYEKNLGTLYEERKSFTDLSQNVYSSPTNGDIECIYGFNTSFVRRQLPQTPNNFDDKSLNKSARLSNGVSDQTDSSQSLTSTNTSDSFLDQQRQTATNFRFSYSQPRSFQQTTNNQSTAPRNDGLPPKISSCDTRRSHVMHNLTPTSNGVNRSESYRTSLCDGLRKSNDLNGNIAGDRCGGNLDLNSTILSDTSTLRGDPDTTVIHSDKYAELENIIEGLKRKLTIKDKELISKEKELTDLQLKQWSSDYLNDQLKTSIGKLEKENAQLKAIVVKFNSRVNNDITRLI